MSLYLPNLPTTWTTRKLELVTYQSRLPMGALLAIQWLVAICYEQRESLSNADIPALVHGTKIYICSELVRLGNML